MVQLAATAASIDDVLDHLFYRTWQQGAVAVTGRLDPRFMQPLSDKSLPVSPARTVGAGQLEQARILRSFQTGDACFSRFDGEWSLRF